MRFPVQWVIRPNNDDHHDYRGYAGTVAGGVLQAGDEVVVLPGGQRTESTRSRRIDGPVDQRVPDDVGDTSG